MDNFMIGFIQLLGFILISRVISDKATKKLDQEKKAELIDLFSNRGTFSFAILIGVLALYFVSLKFNWFDPLITYAVYIVLLLAFVIINGYMSYRKLKDNNFPDSYIKSYVLSSSLRFVGMITFFLLMDF